MKPSLLTINVTMDSYGVALADRGEVIFTAAARAIAYSLPLPSTKVENPFAWYKEKYDQEVKELLAEINESTVIRFEQAAQLAKEIWVFRYFMVYDPISPTIMKSLDVIAESGDRHLPARYKDLVQKYAPVLQGTTNAFITELTKHERRDPELANATVAGL